jgi:hypothetical protein
MSLTTKQQVFLGKEDTKWAHQNWAHLNHLLPSEVSQQEVSLLVKTPAEKAQVGELGKELKRYNPNHVVLGLARLWYSDNSSYYQIKKALKNAIKVEKSQIEMALAVTKLINA